MKRSFLLSVAVLILATLPNITSTAAPHIASGISARPDCVKCSRQGDCRACTGGGVAMFCTTPDCGTCTETGLCTPGGGGPGGFGEGTTQAPPIRVEPKLIRDIAVQHARFAATIANQNMFGFYDGVYQVYWTPVEISSEDIEAFLNRRENVRFFKSFNDRARRINRLIDEGKAEEITYELSVQREGKIRTIKLLLKNDPFSIKVDPPNTSLEIKLVYADDDKGLEKVKKPIETSWQIK